MKLDRNTLYTLSEMPDDRLWRTLRMFAASMGLEIPERARGRLHYEAIRRTLAGITDRIIARTKSTLSHFFSLFVLFIAILLVY